MKTWLKDNCKWIFYMIGIIFIVVMIKIPSSRERGILLYEFEDFRTELESLNKNISKILTTGEIEKHNGQKLIKVSNFRRTYADIIDYKNTDYIDFYSYFLENTLENILEDSKISSSEEKYLNTLYEYNDVLIESHKKAINYDVQDIGKTSLRIIKICKNYSSEANTLFKDEKYRMLENYEGDFPNLNEEYITEFCKEVYGKLAIDNLIVETENKGDINKDKLIFKTDIKGDNSVSYIIEYDKATQLVSVRTMGYEITKKSLKISDNHVDELANNIMKSFYEDVKLYNRQPLYYNGSEANKDFRGIKYSYIYYKDGIYDENKKIELTINSLGLIEDFTIPLPVKEELQRPKVSKEDIIKNIREGVSIEKTYPLRNSKGEMEYEIQVKENGKIYGAIYDGNTGEFKEYRNILREY